MSLSSTGPAGSVAPVASRRTTLRGGRPSVAWWQLPEGAALAAVHAGGDGLTTRQAAARRRVYGANVLATPPAAALARQIGKRLANPLVLVLLIASAIAALTGDAISFGFVIVVVVLSIALDLALEHRAGRAVEALRRGIALRVDVRPKESAVAALESLARHGVALKIVTGDGEAVTRHLCAQLAIPVRPVCGSPVQSRVTQRSSKVPSAQAETANSAVPSAHGRLMAKRLPVPVEARRNLAGAT